MSRLAVHNRNTPSRRGFTLVEVLIALVVLLIGVYAIFAIFPRGYSAMEASQMRVTAAQLAEAELARWKLTPESIPDQIVATDYNGLLIPGTLVGTRNVNGNPGTVANMLLVWNQRAMPLPDSQNYHAAALDDKMFVNLDRIRGALYLPEDLTSCQFDPVTGLGTASSPLRQARLHPNWQPNSLYLPRTVIGEQINIKRLGSQSTGVPFYLLSHAPLDVLRYEPPPTPLDPVKTVWMDVYESQPWQYVPYIQALVAGAGITLQAHQFTYDPASKKLVFGPMTNGAAAQQPYYQRSFKVDYTAMINGVATRVYGLTVWTTMVNGYAQAPLSYPPQSELSFRVFQKLRAMTDDEYKRYLEAPTEDLKKPLWPRDAYYISAQSKVTGMIEFCPFLQTDPQPNDIARAKVDYRVQDWQILVFDVEVPPDGEVRLPIAHLKGSGYTNPPRQERPQELARGVREYYQPAPDPVTGLPVPIPRDAADPTTWAYVVAVDRQNGDILTDIDRKDLLSITDTLPSNPYDRRTRVRVDFRNGILYFNYSPKQVPKGTYNPNVDTPNRSGRTYRIFCRGESDWAVQLLPAARIYARSTTNRPDGAPVGGEGAGALLAYSWRWTSPQLQPEQRQISRQLYFPLSEIGQSVAVDYYRDDGTFIEGEIHTIGGPQVTDLKCWVGALEEPLRYLPDGMGPVGVRGLSVRARVVWVGKGRRANMEDVATAVDRGVLPGASMEESWYQLISTTFVPRTPI